jgi:outer membrane immunogenic protein
MRCLNIRQGLPPAIFAAIGLCLCSGQIASAADMRAPVYKASPMSPMMLGYNWSGIYVGGHGGYSWATSTGPGAGGVKQQGGYGGGQIGFNYQAPQSPFVFGLEADVSFGDIKDTIVVNFPGGFQYIATSKSDVFGTVRGRAGYAFDRTLLYVTGGWVWSRTEVDARDTFSGWTGSDTQRHNGWTIGGGAEWAIFDPWSVKVEYGYSKFEEKTYFAAETNPATAGAYSHSVRAGINYRFGGGKGPVVARY